MSVKSMTAQGIYSATDNDGTLVCEMRTINHRHLDIVIRGLQLPWSQEAIVTSIVKSRITRGRVEMILSWTPSTTAERVSWNSEIFSAYSKAIQKAYSEVGAPESAIALALANLAQRKEICTLATDMPPRLSDAHITDVVSKTLDQITEMRAKEGHSLALAMGNMLTQVENLLEGIEEQRAQALSSWYLRLRDRVRLATSGMNVNDDRIEHELAVMSDRTDIAEEIVRARSHCEQLREILKSDQVVGRKIDFLLQELLREVTTTANKAQDSLISRCVVSVKSHIEQIREQSFNIE